MKNIQLWSPDTCNCRIHQVIDDALPGVVSYAIYAEADFGVVLGLWSFTITITKPWNPC